MLKLRHFTISWKIFTHFGFDVSNTSQKSWNRGNKTPEKVTGANQKHMEELLTIE